MAEATVTSADVNCAATFAEHIARIAAQVLPSPATFALIRLGDTGAIIGGGGLLPRSVNIDPALVLQMTELGRDGRWRWLRESRHGDAHDALRAALPDAVRDLPRMCGAPAVLEDGTLAGVLVAFEDEKHGCGRTRSTLTLLAQLLAGCGADVRDYEARMADARPLAELRQALTLAARDVPTGLAVLDLSGEIRVCDAAFARMAGVEGPHALVGHDLTAVGLSPATTSALLARAHKNGSRVADEVDRTLGDGRAARVALRLEPLRVPRADGGTTEHLLMLALDDVESAHTLATALGASRERLRLLERATNDVSWEWDISKGTLTWNDVGVREFRFHDEEVKPEVEWHVSRIHPEDRERIITGLQATVAGVAELWSDEYRFRRGDGSYVWILNRACVVRNGRSEAVRMVGWMIDVSQRKRSEEAQRFLSDAGALLDAGLSAPHMLESIARHCVPALGDCCVIDLVDERRESTRIAMAHASAPIERQMRDWMRENGSLGERRDSPIRRALDCGESQLVAFAAATGDADEPCPRLAFGPVAPTSFMVVPIKTRTRVLGAITLCAMDDNRRYYFTDLMVAEELAQRTALALENAHLYETARRALRDRQDVLGIVSHDLKTPLSSIMLTASLLREDSYLATEEGERRVDSILDAARQMNALIGDLLDVSRIESGHFTVRTSPESAVELLDRATAMFAPLVADKGITLHVDTGEELSRVLAERDQIGRVLSNLIGNALKFTPKGGVITVRATQRPNDVLFSVDDTGPGLTPEQVPHVFQPFWTAGTDRRHGSGLGLAIAQGIVEAHGGKLWVDKGWARGSRFVFTLPCEAPEAVATPVAA